MATLQQVEAHRRNVADVTTLAMRDLVSAWRTFTLDDAAEATRQVKSLLPLIIDGYGSAIGALSADWYDELRDAAMARGQYVATVGGLPESGRVQALARWGVGPLWAAVPDGEAALSLISGGMQRLLANVDRGTVASNVRRDPARARWARSVSAKACAFCSMLATRDAAYRSEQTASFEAHDSCRCLAVPVWPGDLLERPDYYDAYDAAYLEASRKASGTKAILAEMRQILGAN